MSLCDIEEHPQVHSVSHPKARKEHRCDECRRTINVGETYRRDFSVVAGDTATCIFCGDCENLMAAFHKALDASDEASGLTFCNGQMRSAIIEARNDFGVVVPGFEYPAA